MIKQAKRVYSLLIVLLMTTLLAGCFASHSDNKLYFNRQQSIVMEPSVLAVGIVAGKPLLTRYEQESRHGDVIEYAILSCLYSLSFLLV